MTRSLSFGLCPAAAPSSFRSSSRRSRRTTGPQFAADLGAGVVVGIVALPLAIAFAIASGVTPDRGLWTAIVAGFLVSALGGSRVQIGGPTGAFVVIVYGIVQQHGVNGLLVATLMAGVMLILFGVAKLGAVIKFIPHPVITGFTSGIAVIIFAGQVKDFLGLRMGDVPADFVEKLAAYSLEPRGASISAAVGVASLTLAIILLWPRVSRALPGAVRGARRHDGRRSGVRAAGGDDRVPLRLDRGEDSDALAAATSRWPR